MKLPSDKKLFLKTFIVRCTKFDLIGSGCFALATLLYFLAFSTFGIWTWIVANSPGVVLNFVVVSYFNKKKRGVMFESYKGR